MQAARVINSMSNSTFSVTGISDYLKMMDSTPSAVETQIVQLVERLFATTDVHRLTVDGIPVPHETGYEVTKSNVIYRNGHTRQKNQGGSVGSPGGSRIPGSSEQRPGESFFRGKRAKLISTPL